MNIDTTSSPRRELLSYAEASNLLGISARTLRRSVERGHVASPKKFGGCVRFYRSDIDEFLRRLRQVGNLAVDQRLYGSVS